ncbi:DNA polymerase epsilon subunit C [Xylogone sp. PMI_703]|nr:DNA polymerase epsilon subunit C [Xylogone sp. PMI_703]
MDSTYAPQSPDLSGFLSSPSKSSQPYQPRNLTPQPLPQSSSYAPRSPVLPSFGNTVSQQQSHRLHGYDAPRAPERGFESGAGEFGGAISQYMPPIPPLPASHSFAALNVQDPLPQHQYAPVSQPFKTEADFHASSFGHIPAYYDPDTMATRGSRNPRGQNPSSSTTIMYDSPSQSVPTTSRKPPPNPNNIEIRTKFPVARIKRIMQADEEVGKVAQVTPVAVSKALELFMISLVTGASAVAKEKGGKRVTAQHLKAVVQGDEQFDFLAEIVGRVQDQEGRDGDAGKKKKVKDEMGSDSEEEVREKKRGKGGRRRKTDD